MLNAPIATRLRRPVIAAVLLLVVSACSSQAADPAVEAAAERARQLTAPSAIATPSSPPAATQRPSPTPSSGTPDDAAGESSATPSTSRKAARTWRTYPWPSSAWPACDPPSSSPGIDTSPGNAGIAVIVGDSLIRDGRSQLTSALADVGYRPVFICKGGTGLQWGEEQLATLRSLKLVPRCLVVNLGTNDLKGTTEQGLRDAVPLEQVGERLRSLLMSAADIETVLVMDISADTDRAPSTLATIASAPAAYASVIDDAGVGTLVPWAQIAGPSASNFGPDGVHDSAAGARQRARAIATAVRSHCR